MTSRCASICMIVAVCSAAISIQALAGDREQAAENKAIVLKAFEILGSRQYDKLDEVIATDYRRHCQATPEAKVESLEDFKALSAEWDKSFPDAKMELDLIAVEGDLVAFYGRFFGTQKGPMGSFPATGKWMTCDFAGFHRLEDGKIVETWVTWDNLATLTQLGLFPPPPPSEGGAD
ncbi:MAG: ester cyclase [Candidatus Glassbacteria bacterium]